MFEMDDDDIAICENDGYMHEVVCSYLLAPSLWNSLPLSIRNLALIEFKCKLKDYLLADVN